MSAIAFSPDGQYLAYGGLSDQIHLLDFESGDEIRSYRGHLYSAAAIAFDPTGRRLVSFAGDKNIMIWDTKTSPDRLVLAGHTGNVREIRVTPDHTFIVTAGEDGFLVVRESESGEIVARWKCMSHKSLAWHVRLMGGLFPSDWIRNFMSGTCRENSSSR